MMTHKEILDALERGRSVSGLANCHTHGMYSLVLHERESPYIGQTRIFYMPHDLPLINSRGLFTIAPHTHRQDIRLTQMYGRVKQHLFIPAQEKESNSRWYHRYQFTSGITGEMTAKNDQGRFVRSAVHLLEDEFMWAQDIHTVSVHEPSAWIVREGRLTTSPHTYAYNTSAHWIPSAEGLYVPMTREQQILLGGEIFETYMSVVEGQSVLNTQSAG